jgi:hypothetical protein
VYRYWYCTGTGTRTALKARTEKFITEKKQCFHIPADCLHQGRFCRFRVAAGPMRAARTTALSCCGAWRSASNIPAAVGGGIPADETFGLQLLAEIPEI